jgi:signal transduction histidine kinase/ligand-binding sensor domain-containing protein
MQIHWLFKKNRFRKVFTIALSILLVNASPVNSQQINISRVSLSGGILTGIIIGITQDPKGYMWFITGATGLYRYDGYHTLSYKHQPLNPNSIASDRIECIAADSTGNIWLGTFGKGLDRFDPVTLVFTHFTHDPKNDQSLISDSVKAIIQDHEGFLWIGTIAGLDRMDPKTGKLIHFRNNATDLTSLSNNEIRALYEDHQHNIWVGTGSPFFGDNPSRNHGGLNRFDRRTGKFTRYMNDPKNTHSLIDNRVRVIFEDSRGTFWVGTAGDGLHTMDRETGIFERHLYDPAHPEKLSRPPLKKDFNFADDHITFINEDVTGAIWIGTFEGGLNRYDPKSQKIKFFASLNDSVAGIKDPTGWWGYPSNDGLLWVSTWNKNLFQLNPYQKKIPHYDLQDAANSIYQETPGLYWIGTDHSGLIRDDRILGRQQKFLHDPLNHSSISSNGVFVIRRNKKGNFWIGTATGLDLFDPKTQTFTNYNHDQNNKSSLGDNIIMSLYVDAEDNLWVGTVTGLDYMNTKTGMFTHYQVDKKYGNSPEIYVNSILEDRKGRLWVGTFYGAGLNQLDLSTGKFKNYFAEKSITSSIFEDSDGTIWVGTNDGLYRFNPSSDSFFHFINPESGASMETVYNILEDDKKNLWIVTSNELIRLNPARNKTIRFGKSQGVDQLNFAWGDNGGGGSGKEIFFGDQTGYYVFQPELLTINNRPPQILLENFRLAGQAAQYNMNDFMTQPLWKTKEINLAYNQNIFSFDLLAIHYSNPKDNRITYMLENYDNTWRESGVDQRAYYFNVPSGKYTLRMKAANGNGVWTERDIKITVTPPWWRTWWAYTLFAALFAGSIWAFIFYRSRNLKRHNKQLEEKVKQRTNDLNQSLEELKATQKQLIQQEKMASLGELTAGIAHEIQNPLNFVNNFSEVNTELTDELKEELNKINIPSSEKSQIESIVDDISQNQQKINHHGKRADAIVKSMLQHSRSSTGKKEPTAINALADEYLRLSYHGLRAKDKSFNAIMQTNFDESIDKINIVPQDIGRVLLNLFNNAFYSVNEKKGPLPPEGGKKNPQEYQPTVSVSTNRIGDRVEIRVRDNGNGIPQKVLDKIFQPFFTTKPTGQGTGLGLSLSYDIIKAHGGELKVETKEGEGAEFIIQLPLT